ncbi:sugar ABC transporter permease [Brachybacterium sp. JB7]|uniref:carbohydrate ABC transporter permease n=1 Tax=Brachybacterium TaxID=43668 RepID=UPI000BB730BD|nr:MULTISPECIES: sugar ABC transporter permease [Brachybacterium]PCC30839.1 ABC transporter permease [Brachybacterium alimentarium]RCS61683.1 sugar ABC transporter permease [Brachybacterium sp. JB7]RCS63732.1 sugar ABC transporter permease [Brachybacterium alimentarium]RCS65417.1 sugar ABC transporter permease [Brachybacterium alimentarium]RCS75629.1 sugar ABC transporter permease [Brachybacterium alimentarium]
MTALNAEARPGPAGPAPRTGPPRPQRSGRPRSLTHRPTTGIVLVAPAIALVTFFALIPLAFAVYISFTNWPLIGEYRFVGLDNYVQAVRDPGMWKALRYTLLYTAIVTVPILLLGYGLAVLVRANRRGSTLLRTIFFIPYVVGLTTLSYMLVLEAQPDSGALNRILAAIGVSDGSTAWLLDGTTATILLSGLVIWAVPGLTMILLLSAMQGIPSEVYEAADIDGASWLRRELSITAPIIRPAIGMSLIISVIGSFLAFNQFFILTKGGPGTDTMTIVGYIYNRAFVELQLGSATAISLILVLFTALITVLQFVLLRGSDE